MISGDEFEQSELFKSDDFLKGFLEFTNLDKRVGFGNLPMISKQCLGLRILLQNLAFRDQENQNKIDDIEDLDILESLLMNLEQNNDTKCTQSLEESQRDLFRLLKSSSENGTSLLPHKLHC